MTDGPLISVIIPTFNRDYCLTRAVDSVLNQTYKNFEVWVVDDGSNDQTEELMSPYNVNYLRTENRGVSAARNLGIDKAKGEWVAFLDSDDEWLPNKLAKQVELLKQKPDLTVVHGNEQWIRNGKKVNQKKIHTKYGGWIFQKCLPLCLISPSAVMIKKNVLLEEKGFDEEFPVCEDYDLWLKLTSKYEVGFVEEPIILKYGGHFDQLSQKYFAMDYWRVKSMNRILQMRKFESSDIRAIKDQIINKCEILIAGYKKHNNMENYDEVVEILENNRDDSL